MDKEQELRQGVAYVRACLEDMHTRTGDASLTEEEQRSWDEGVSYVKDAEAQLKRYDEARQFARRGYVSAPNVIVSRDPQEALNDVRGMDARQAGRVLVDANLRAMEEHGEHMSREDQVHFEKVLKRHSGDTSWASNILARQSEVYQDAFAKVMTGREVYLTNEERAALNVGQKVSGNTASEGGYLLPTHLDPTIILTNSGTSNVIRGLARTVTLSAPGATVWNGVTSAGMVASFHPELTEVTDRSPVFDRVSIPIHKAQSFAQASIEAFEDIAGLAGDLSMMFADARDRLEGAAHATGSGSGAPTGIFTALDANTNVEILLDDTTNNALAVADLHEVYRSVPVRWRGKGQWLMHPLYALAVKSLGTAVSHTYSGDLREPTTGRILGRPVVESDDAPSTSQTTTRDGVLIYGDFSNYVIVDKPGSMAVEYIPHMFNTSNNLPDGRRGWYCYWRTGADSVNDLAFRLLQDNTTA